MKKILMPVISVVVILTLVISSFSVLAYVGYTDVFENHWAYEAIEYATNRGWFNGFSDGSFKPDNPISRAEAVKVIVSYLGRDTSTSKKSIFSDVKTEDWFYPYVCAGEDLLPRGNQLSNLFRPAEYVTREDTVFALVRSMQLNKLVEYISVDILNKFSDGAKVSDSIKTHMAIALQLGLISGYTDSTIRPGAPLSRAEFAALLYRGLKIKGGEKSQSVNTIKEHKPKEVEEKEQEVATLFSGMNLDHQNQLLGIINEERAKQGVAALVLSDELTLLAQKKAEDMRDNGYFGHVSPTYGTSSDMIRDFGVKYRNCAGENIAQDKSTAQMVVDIWMTERYYKSRMFNPNFSKTGIGYVPEGNIWVQLFVG